MLGRRRGIGKAKTTTLQFLSAWRSAAMSLTSAVYLVHASGLTFQTLSSPLESGLHRFVCMRRKAAHAAARLGSLFCSTWPYAAITYAVV